MSLVWLNSLVSSLHVCLGITMSTHLLMLKVVRSAIPDARRRIDSQRFRDDESKLKEKCRKARVNYEEPQENEDYLLGSVNREEKEKADNLTDIRRRRLRKRVSRKYERADARRRIDGPIFKQKEDELKERCRKAGVKYKGPQENEDYLLSSVDREEKERAQEFTKTEEKCSMIVLAGHTSEKERMMMSAGKPFGARLAMVIPTNDSSMCAQCATPSGSAAKSSLPCRKKSSCQTKLASAWEPFRNITG